MTSRNLKTISSRALVLLATLLLFTGCRSTPPATALEKFRFDEPHMGTIFSITLYATDASTANAAAEAAFRDIARMDQMMSDYNPDSELRQLCRQPVGQPTHVSPELFDIIRESERVTKETGGAFDITVGPFVQAWRFARKNKTFPTPDDIARLRKSVGYQNLRLDARAQSVTLLVPNMQLDLGGIAKGYSADRALAIVRRMGIKSALVAASGDIAIGAAPPGKPGWDVGIQAFDDSPDQLSRTIFLHDAGISTSGDSEQYYEFKGIRYSHIIDPATGLGMTNRIQTTIIGPNATITDGLDTPTAIMGVKRALALVNSQPKLAALIVTHDSTGKHVFLSRQFKRRFGTN
jgi:thiamine biosynthesis lipoprotein